MNIFTTSPCPIESAKALPDILLNKMLQEQVQLLSVAHYELDGTQRGTKPSHKNHPCAKFTRNNKSNYQWVLEHALALMAEYEHRKGKIHGYKKYLDQVLSAPKNIPETGDNTFPMCMPDEAVKSFDVHKNYKYYLNLKYKDWMTRTDKRQIIPTWTNRNKPEWVEI